MKTELEEIEPLPTNSEIRARKKMLKQIKEDIRNRALDDPEWAKAWALLEVASAIEDCAGRMKDISEAIDCMAR